jgi:hypothetical protein
MRQSLVEQDEPSHWLLEAVPQRGGLQLDLQAGWEVHPKVHLVAEAQAILQTDQLEPGLNHHALPQQLMPLQFQQCPRSKPSCGGTVEHAHRIKKLKPEESSS